MDIKGRDEAYIAHTYARYDVALKYGKGTIVYDEQEQSYLDYTSGIGVNILGHSDEGWIHAVTQQLTQITHCSNLFYNQASVEVAQCLCERTKCKKVFFANSGAEVNEGAIKVARKYSHDKYGGHRNEIITLKNSFHGRSITTLAATGQDHFHQHFMPFTDGFVYASANDFCDILRKVNDNTCAIMLEIVQGEGGVITLEQEFVKQIAMYCYEHDVLLIVDEVQTGIGRCGSLYAYEQYDIQPDIVTSAKALGGGIPIGAILLFDKVENTLSYGDHGTTFGGNPIACASASYILNACDTNLLQEVIKKGHYFKQKLESLPHVQKVSGLGLLLGVGFDICEGRDIVHACLKKGALFLTAKEKLRILPPLTITYEQIDQGISILYDVLSHV